MQKDYDLQSKVIHFDTQIGIQEHLDLYLSVSDSSCVFVSVTKV